MFKKNKVAISVVTGILGLAGVMTSAQAVHVNQDGTGQVLLFPYYNANDGYVTNVNLVNSTDQTKAVKIRFREGKSSNDVLDFNIYMSPEDIWTGSVKAGDDGKGNMVGTLSTSDRTCTLPALASCADGKCQAEVPFTGHNLYKGVTAADTREGYIEVHNVLATLPFAETDFDGFGLIGGVHKVDVGYVTITRIVVRE